MCAFTEYSYEVALIYLMNNESASVFIILLYGLRMVLIIELIHSIMYLYFTYLHLEKVIVLNDGLSLIFCKPWYKNILFLWQ